MSMRGGVRWGDFDSDSDDNGTSHDLGSAPPKDNASNPDSRRPSSQTQEIAVARKPSSSFRHKGGQQPGPAVSYGSSDWKETARNSQKYGTAQGESKVDGSGWMQQRQEAQQGVKQRRTSVGSSVASSSSRHETPLSKYERASSVHSSAARPKLQLSPRTKPLNLAAIPALSEKRHSSGPEEVVYRILTRDSDNKKDDGDTPDVHHDDDRSLVSALSHKSGFSLHGSDDDQTSRRSTNSGGNTNRQGNNDSSSSAAGRLARTQNSRDSRQNTGRGGRNRGRNRGGGRNSGRGRSGGRNGESTSPTMIGEASTVQSSAGIQFHIALGDADSTPTANTEKAGRSGGDLTNRGKGNYLQHPRDVIADSGSVGRKIALAEERHENQKSKGTFDSVGDSDKKEPRGSASNNSKGRGRGRRGGGQKGSVTTRIEIGK